MNHTLHYLLDTDMCIYLLNGHARVEARVAEVGVTVLAVAIPTVGELQFETYNSGRVEANVALVRVFLSSPGSQVLLIDEPAAEHFGRFKALLCRTGRPLGDIDLFMEDSIGVDTVYTPAVQSDLMKRYCDTLAAGEATPVPEEEV